MTTSESINTWRSCIMFYIVWSIPDIYNIGSQHGGMAPFFRYTKSEIYHENHRCKIQVWFLLNINPSRSQKRVQLPLLAELLIVKYSIIFCCWILMLSSSLGVYFSDMLNWLVVSNILSFHPKIGEDKQFDRAYFSDGVVQPSTSETISDLHPWQLTCLLKINGWKMYFLLK